MTKPTIYNAVSRKDRTGKGDALGASRDRFAPKEIGGLRADLVVHLEHFRQGTSRLLGSR